MKNSAAFCCSPLPCPSAWFSSWVLSWLLPETLPRAGDLQSMRVKGTSHTLVSMMEWHLLNHIPIISKAEQVRRGLRLFWHFYWDFLALLYLLLPALKAAGNRRVIGDWWVAWVAGSFWVCWIMQLYPGTAADISVCPKVGFQLPSGVSGVSTWDWGQFSEAWCSSELRAQHTHPKHRVIFSGARAHSQLYRTRTDKR